MILWIPILLWIYKWIQNLYIWIHLNELSDLIYSWISIFLIYMKSYRLWIHMFISYLNLYIIHIWIIWIWIHTYEFKWIHIFICIWIHAYEFMHMNSYMESYKLWIHMIFWYINAYVLHEFIYEFMVPRFQM